MKKLVLLFSIFILAILSTSCSSGGSGNSEGTNIPSPDTISHGSQLTAAMVGPGAIGITSFVDVAGGNCGGKTYQCVPSEWVTKGVTRVVTADSEIIDGYSFPKDTVVVQGANITSMVFVYGNSNPGTYGTGAVGIVFRGCKFRFAGNAGNISVRSGHDMNIMVSYCDLGAKENPVVAADAQADAFVGVGSPGKPFIIKRNYISRVVNGGEVNYNVIIEENLVENFWSTAGDHSDGWQFGFSPNSDITVVRNKIRLDAPFGPTGCVSCFNEDAGGYSNVVIDNNYFSGGSYSLYLPHQSNGVSNVKVRGNRWSTEINANCGIYGPVYSTDPMNPNVNGNEWSDNKWFDGANAGTDIHIPGY